MKMLDIIRHKHSGHELTAEQIEYVALGAGEDFYDYQLSALLMAICYEGLSYDETLNLTKSFIASGETLDWSHLERTAVDKHSTGGVGDKTSILLMPWLAAVGFATPKMSGRGLGHTGGTIDKLESIPGFNVKLSPNEFEDALEICGAAITAQTKDFVKADKKFYHLRDATDTVNEMGLIAASVISKKVAAGAKYIVLDVKCGNGAFFKDITQAKQFSEVAIKLGKDLDRRIACVITNMNQPLGTAVGNALEVQEVISQLHKQSHHPDLLKLCATLGSVLLELSGKAKDHRDGLEKMLEVYRQDEYTQKSAVMSYFVRWIDLQKGSISHFKQNLDTDKSHKQIDILSTREGWISSMDTTGIGEFARSLGAGRYHINDKIDPLVGINCFLKTGTYVGRGDLLASLIVKKDSPRTDEELASVYQGLITIQDERVEEPEIILEIVMPV